MKVGDLVRFVLLPAPYRDRVGVVMGFDTNRPLVHFAGLEGQARDAVATNGLHLMYHEELEIVNASR